MSTKDYPAPPTHYTRVRVIEVYKRVMVLVMKMLMGGKAMLVSETLLIVVMVMVMVIVIVM